MLSIVLHPDERDALRRIETLTELPTGCLRATSRSVRSIFYRWGCCLLRIDAGELTAAWIVRPWNVPLRFDEKLPNGFGVASTEPRDTIVSVLGQRITTVEGQIHAALAVLVTEVNGGWIEPCEHDQSRLDVARETVAMWNMERHRVGPKVERHDLSPPYRESVVNIIVKDDPRKPNGHKRTASR